MSKVFAVLGSFGSGKTTFSKKIIKNKKNSIIEVDDLRRYILWTSLEQKHIEIRKYIIKKFEVKNFDNNFFFDRELFTKELFANKNKLFLLNKLIKKEVYCKVKKEKIRKRNVFIVWSFILEDDYLFDKFIYCNMSERNRMKNLGLDFINLKVRSNFELSKIKKFKKLKNKSGIVVKNFQFLKVKNV